MAKRGRKSKDTPELRKKIEQALVKTGAHKFAIKEAGICKDTYYHWIKTKPDFSDFVGRARERFDKLDVRHRVDLRERAVEGLEWSLTKRVVEVEKKRVITDRDGDGNKTGSHEIIEIKKVIRDPNWNAIEKVIGRRELEYLILNKALKDGTTDHDAPLFKRIFGQYGKESISEDWGENILSESIDLMRIRILQAETQEKYEAGLMPLEEYHTLVTEQSKSFVFIKEKIENRAAKLIEGYTPEEILLQIKNYMFLVVKTIKEVVDDVGISRKDISDEFARRIKASTGKAEISVGD